MPRARQTYTCDKCGYQTYLISSFKRHQNRRTPCDKNNTSTSTQANTDTRREPVVSPDIRNTQIPINNPPCTDRDCGKSSCRKNCNNACNKENNAKPIYTATSRNITTNTTNNITTDMSRNITNNINITFGKAPKYMTIETIVLPNDPEINDANDNTDRSNKPNDVINNVDVRCVVEDLEFIYLFKYQEFINYLLEQVTQDKQLTFSDCVQRFAEEQELLEQEQEQEE